MSEVINYSKIDNLLLLENLLKIRFMSAIQLLEAIKESFNLEKRRNRFMNNKAIKINVTLAINRRSCNFVNNYKYKRSSFLNII